MLADDLCIVVDGRVLAGPRCLDVRSHPDIDVGDGKLVRDARHRITLAPAPDAVPIVGIVQLEWGDRPELIAVPVEQRFPNLFAQRMFNVHLELDPVALLGLLAAPMLTLTRPMGAAGLAAGVRAATRAFLLIAPARVPSSAVVTIGRCP